MINNTEYNVENKQRGKTFKIKWSDYIEVNKFNILKKTTEMTGIFVVFTLNKYKRLTPLILGIAWYTGFRPTLLMLCSTISSDPIPQNIRDILENEKNYFKYLEISNLQDMIDIYYKLSLEYSPVFKFQNGIEIIKSADNIKIDNINTKQYRKSVTLPDI